MRDQTLVSDHRGGAGDARGGAMHLPSDRSGGLRAVRCLG
eukprot:SAG11_NODE_1667_length_4494_cov_5.922412_6_plen_40_part_00